MTTPANAIRALLALILVQLCALASADAFWDVKISLIGKGVVECETFDPTEEPAASKVFKESGKIVVKEGFEVVLTFRPADGYQLEQVIDNGRTIVQRPTTQPFTYRFVIHGDHNLFVRFGVDSPTGNFDLQYKEGTGATPIVDVTGSYTGVIPTKNNPYTADVAMDESGKIDAMGSVDGFTNKEGSNELEGSGALKTRNGTPTVRGNASAAGMLDGVPVSGSGEAKAPVVVTEGIGGPEIQGVVASGAGKEDGVRYVEEPQMVTVPAQPANIDKTWSLALSLDERTDAKGRSYVVASGILNLPNGDKTQFSEKRVAYSVKRGYSINFRNGVKLDSLGEPILNDKGDPVIDRKSTIAASKMVLEKAGAVWEPTSGILKYKFLGQKGKGDVLDFL